MSQNNSADLNMNAKVDSEGSGEPKDSVAWREADEQENHAASRPGISDEAYGCVSWYQYETTQDIEQ